MKVLNLRKTSEKSIWLMLATLEAVFVYLLKTLSQKHFLYEPLLILFMLISLVLTLLILSSKSELTICRHGVFYSSPFGNAHIEATKTKLIKQYSKFGFNCVIIIGEKFFIFAPFYSLTSRQLQRLKRYDYNLLHWLQVTHKRSKFQGL
ncbi:hypothetical protein NH514_14950 [Pseudoalteromonas sp. ACER1]|jgi:hypothetical protein|uniref:Uncharacterized protein n=1 Tax=Pseudoalteromonas lipolytica TaxID=570156 RepID=A0A0P7ENT8_9GAMM|nr:MULTISPECIES: hypothetical protein [unclassified Pseudoalteromonas]KPM84374.1 hypothetical protein AOG27_05610 [Pseudoalteromonas lipolytica]MAH28284.1 hypothetical protein [Pseudoalteromonadaceae bacterium]TMP48541.1 hypothetical protein CWB80_03340 [Pseudoalteromonas sp. S1650]TMP66124.1 hypothetical protein CWB79_13320 [Pseudoalteromonas sp. S1649]MCF2848545.1 hypothetical protein [Pseudoalteromonas sp. PAST1]|tara:strand:- start:634 stop:1080 length:447 start_codon:yes stop_codon:yes gene_type:complete